MRSWFSFNGTDSRNYGIVLSAAAPLQRGKERVKQITIPGRAGVLTIAEGADVYENYIQSVEIAIKGEYNMRTILSWLKGEGFVTFSNDPDREQKARIINALSFTRVSAHLDWYKGQVQFYCEPFKRDKNPHTHDMENGVLVVNNPGDVVERPVITLRGLGTAVLNIAYADGTSGTFTVKNINDTQCGCVIDCDARDVISLNGDLMTNQSDGEFPAFPVGLNKITYSGSMTVQITRAVRYL